MLSVGIIGLPNVGKSSLFNALTVGKAEVSNYPFTTIESNTGMVPVPDPLLQQLADVLQPEKTTPCSIRFIDIAGLIKGASEGEGLGNQFLGEIRQVDVVIHVVRCFATDDVAHVFADVDPVRDLGVVDTELVLADLEVLNRAIAKRDRDWATHPAEHVRERDRMLSYREALESGTQLRDIATTPDDRRELKRAGLLTGKPVLYLANASDLESGVVDTLRSSCSNASVLALDVGLELELRQLDPEERAEFMSELGLERSGLDAVVGAAFDLLGLIRFFTIVKNKLQAWEVPTGTTAPTAAGQIHSDMEQGFIRAKVTQATDLCSQRSVQALQQTGKIRTVGKDYEVQDGDVMEFLFSQ
ncbi:MAG: redox-regulated ATPase YchF [bacterium]|nr:redox-regulated ATPase YchF [bacterium]